MVDVEGYRPNVGIVLANGRGQLLWAKRVRMDAWQFPQGGINPGETPEQAMFRELNEELGLEPPDVQVLGGTQGWLRYRLPPRFLRRGRVPLCIGQKQKWFALRLVSTEDRVRFDRGHKPEFEHWRWVDPTLPLREVVSFKRDVYLAAIEELHPFLQAPRQTAAPVASEETVFKTALE